MSDRLIFLLAVRDGEPKAFRIALLREIMGRGATAFDDDGITYADGGGTRMFIADGDADEAALFSDFAGQIFFDNVWALADRIGAFITWIAPEGQMAVTRRDMLADVGAEFVQSFKEVFVVPSGPELFRVYDEERGPLAARAAGRVQAFAQMRPEEISELYTNG
jgi:hypothetical protein